MERLNAQAFSVGRNSFARQDYSAVFRLPRDDSVSRCCSSDQREAAMTDLCASTTVLLAALLLTTAEPIAKISACDD
jgi:hypothetical protein